MLAQLRLARFSYKGHGSTLWAGERSLVTVALCESLAEGPGDGGSLWGPQAWLI